MKKVSYLAKQHDCNLFCSFILRFVFRDYIPEKDCDVPECNSTDFKKGNSFQSALEHCYSSLFGYKNIAHVCDTISPGGGMSTWLRRFLTGPCNPSCRWTK